MESRVKSKRKKKKWKRWVFGVILIFLFIGGGAAYYIWDKIGDTIETMHNPLSRDKDPERQKELKKSIERYKIPQYIITRCR